MENDKTKFVTVFSSNNNALFQVAKSILENNRIKFFSSGDFLNPLEPAVYGTEIKVLDRDESTARELLSGIVPEEYHPKSKLARKMLSLRWFWYIVIIILFVIILIGFIYLIK